MKTITLSIEALRELWSGLLLDLVTKICGEDGPEWVEELKRFLRKEPTWTKRFLKFVRKVELPVIDEFHLNDIIESGTIDDIDVVLGNNFKEVLGGKVEENIPAETLQIHELTENSVDNPIIAELGGKEVAVVKLAQVFAFMRQQGRQKESSWFIFYVEDDKGKLWAVDCGWSADYGFCYVDACSTSRPHEWYAGLFFVSRFCS